MMNNNGQRTVNLKCCTLPEFTQVFGAWVRRLPEEKKAELRAALIDMATGRRPFLSQS